MLVAKLHDPLPKVGVDDFNPMRFEIRIELALLGEHRLALDDAAYATVAEQTMDDAIVLRAIGHPMNLDSMTLGIALELLEILVEPRECVLLNERGGLTQLFPFGHTLGREVTLLTHEPDCPVMPFRPLPIGQEQCCSFGMGHVGEQRG